MGLNKSKGQMYGFVTHTWNTIKGKCYHDCSYCHPKGTMILMSDFTEKAIENIKINDKIIGIKKNDTGYYKFVSSNIIDLSKRLSSTIEIKSDDGKLVATKEHPVMGSSKNRNANDFRKMELFKIDDKIRFVGRVKNKDVDFYKGYISGFCDGDGCFFYFKNTGTTNKYIGFEAVCINDNLRNAFIKICNKFGISLKVGEKISSKKSFNKGNKNKMIYSKTQKDVLAIKSICDLNILFQNNNYLLGYLSGMIDTDGSVNNYCIRISQSETVNKNKYNNIIYCCEKNNIPYVKEKDCIRLNGSFMNRSRVIFEMEINHSIKRERLLLNSTIKGVKHSIINNVKINNLHEEVYNLQTECETFIANGFIVHNCYMKRFPQKPVRFDEKELKTDLGSGNFIFVGSSCDMFADNIPDEWIKKTIDYCCLFDNTYLFQTKDPANIPLLRFPEECVFCITLESNRYYPDIMGKSPHPENRIFLDKGFNKMITIEPILDFDLDIFLEMIKSINPFQVNIGADSGNNNLHEPSSEKIKSLIIELNKFTRVFLKDNLKRIYKE